MRVDKPVYCAQINREIHKHIGIPVNVEFHRTFHRSITLSTVRPLYASHAQVIECFHEGTDFLSELSELAKLGFFVSLSKYSSLNDFIESRKRMYEWDKLAYPMYLKIHWIRSRRFQLTRRATLTRQKYSAKNTQHCTFLPHHHLRISLPLKREE